VAAAKALTTSPTTRAKPTVARRFLRVIIM
jgi:hypothetical protein